jgi:uncharacterized protein YndB with AHSA1/START domain
MADILHTLPIRATRERVFHAMTSPEGLCEWWAKSASGAPRLGETYHLDFGPDYQWTAVVRSVDPGVSLEWEMADVMEDWRGTRVGFALREHDGRTWLDFRHTGWAGATEHYRISNCCWAAYLRVLRRDLEHGERVPYEERLDV